MILGARLKPKRFSKFFLSLWQLLRIHERGSKVVVPQAGFGIQRNRLAQNVNRFLVLALKQQSLPKNAMLGRSGRIRGNGGPQFTNRGWIIAFRHVSARQAIVPAIPLRTLLEEIFKLRNGAIELFLVAKGISEVVANAGFLWIQTLRGAILRNRFVKFALIVQDNAQVAVSLPEIGTHKDGMAIGDSRAPQIPLIALRNAHVEVDVSVSRRVGRLAQKRFIEGMESGIVVPVSVECQTQISISLSIRRIDAQGCAGFGKRRIGVFRPVKKVGKLAVSFRRTGRQSRRFHEFIERFVEPVLPPQDGSENKMQQSNI